MQYNLSNELVALDVENVDAGNILSAVNFSNSIMKYNEVFDKAINVYANISNKLKEITTYIKSCSNIGIYGVGNHTDMLLEYFKYAGINKKFYFIDREEKTYKENVTIPEDKIKTLNLDCIIISSYSFEEEIYSRIKKYENKIKIIKLYSGDSLFYLSIMLDLIRWGEKH